jgi:hypothetical protein
MVGEGVRVFFRAAEWSAGRRVGVGSLLTPGSTAR